MRFGLLCVLPLLAAAAAQAQPVDLIVGDIPGTTNYVLAGTPKAYSLAVTICNMGNAAASFNTTTGDHPVVTQNMYRLTTANGYTRFEQIGQAWARHMTTGTVEQNLCTTCNPTGDINQLGAGCSSPSTVSSMGVQSGLGAKSEVNASTGVVTWPMVNQGTNTGTVNTFKRLQVAAADIPSGPLYFVSAMVVGADDAAAGNAANNESYRRVTVGFINSGLPLSVVDTTQQGVPAIQAWHDHGLGVNTPDPSVQIVSVNVPGDGRFWVAGRATDLGGGQWHYEYAVQNMNSDRAAGGFSVPIPPGAIVTNVGFHKVAYHSGEVYDDSQDWTADASGSAVSWMTPATFAQNPNTNALRWDTLSNFRFDCNVPPSQGEVSLNLFKPGTPSAMNVSIVAPTLPHCGSADFNCDGDTGTDADIEAFFACLAGNCPAPPCTGSADFNADGDTGTDADIEAFFRVLAGGTC